MVDEPVPDGDLAAETAAPAEAEPAPAQSEPDQEEWRIPRVNLWVTGVFTVVSVGAVAWSLLRPVAVAVDLVLFGAGCAAFLWAYFRAIGRSRTEVISLPGLFFLAERVAPTPIKRSLWLALVVQIVVAVGAAAARPFSELAFGILVPMFGLAMLAMWGAIHGRFPVRDQPVVE